MRQVIFLLFLLISGSLKGQTVFGKVTDETNSPLPFVTVTLKGESVGTTTNLDGEYTIDLIHEVDTLMFSFIGYDNIQKVSDGGELNIIMGMKTEVIDVAEVVTRVNRNNETILLLDKKQEMDVESSIGSAELSKKGISNAQDGLKKVGGVTFDSDRINVRGLDDRYNQVTLNGLPLPSNNADRKNIDLSLLPTVLLDNIKVKKTYSTDQWSNLGGAQINIGSSDIRDISRVSFGYTFNSQTNRPISSLSFSLGQVKDKIGYLVSISSGINNQYTYGNISLVNKQGNYILDYNFNDDQTTITKTGVGVISYEDKNYRLRNTTFLISQNNLSDRTTIGNHFDYETELYTTRRTPTLHNLFVDQIQFNYYGDKYNFETVGGVSLVRSGENQREQFVYLYDGNYTLNNIDRLDNHIFSNTNQENRYNLTTSVNREFENYKLFAGYSFMLMDNTFDYEQEYFDFSQVNEQYDNIDPNNPYNYINEDNVICYFVNNPSSYVRGQTIINGGFFKGEYYGDVLDIAGGLRVEDVYQSVKYQDPLIPSMTRHHIINNTELLPYLSLKYKLSDTKQIRFNNSITTVRPRFRELTPFIYTEVFAGSKIQGNPELINTKIYNTDLSYEIYPNVGEVLSFNVYNKIIQNPIERVNVATASGRLETYQNSESSTVFGCEIDFRKKINKVKFDYNLSLLWSNITISDEGQSSVVVTNINRPLQGSSPVLSNFDIFYELKEKHNLGLTYNFVGRKLNSVGVFGLGDIYQRQQSFLNLVYNYKNESVVASVRLNNILNTEYVLEQDSDIGKVVTNNFRTGVGLSFSLKYSF
jgi:hypothetical protein